MTRGRNRKTAIKEWRKLSETQQLGIAAAAGAQLTLFLVAQTELFKQPKELVRGRKWLWFFGNFVNFLGPISFLCFGRRRSSKE